MYGRCLYFSLKTAIWGGKKVATNEEISVSKADSVPNLKLSQFEVLSFQQSAAGESTGTSVTAEQKSKDLNSVDDFVNDFTDGIEIHESVRTFDLYEFGGWFPKSFGN